MNLTVDLVYVSAVAALSLGLLLWFILAFIPNVLGLKESEDNPE